MADTPDTAKPVRQKRVPKVAAIESQAADSLATTTGEAKAKFAKAIEEAKAGAQVLASQAQDTAGAYKEKLTGSGEALLDEARALTGQAKEKAATLAVDGKAKAVEAIAGVSKIVADNAATIDEKLGVKYGDYARSAAKTMDDAAARLDAKDLGEIGDDARAFVRKSPGVAIGIAAAAGFLLSRLFKGSGKSDG